MSRRAVIQVTDFPMEESDDNLELACPHADPARGPRQHWNAGSELENLLCPALKKPQEAKADAPQWRLQWLGGTFQGRAAQPGPAK